MKKIESLSEYLGLMLPLNAQSLLRMHAPETAFEYAANLVIPQYEGSRTPLLHRQDVHLLDFPPSVKHRTAVEIAQELAPLKARLANLAKYLNAWDSLAHLVSCGNQKNFQFFMHSIRERIPKILT